MLKMKLIASELEFYDNLSAPFECQQIFTFIIQLKHNFSINQRRDKNERNVFFIDYEEFYIRFEWQKWNNKNSKLISLSHCP